MKPGAVAYVRPDDREEVLALLADRGDEAKVLAGGQSLVPLMNLRFARPECLVDVNDLPGLDDVRAEEGELVIGALTRHATLERRRLDGPWAAFADALPHVGHEPIRVRGTFGGSLSHADPTAELPLLAATFDAALVAERAGGTRSIPAADFLRGPLTTDLATDELLVEARLPAPPAGAVSAFEEFSERTGDFALASVCAAAAFDEDGVCRWARLGLGAVAGVPMRATAAEELLVGRPLSGEVAREVADAARRACRPVTTVAATAEFRRELVVALTRRVLERVAQRAGLGER